MSTLLRSAVVLAAAATLAAASSTKASIINYPLPLSAGGISITNVTETNSNGSNVYTFGDAGAPSYYGQPTFTGTALSFPITGTLPFVSSASGPADSDILGVKLSFDVTAPAGIEVAAFVSEVGDYFGSAGGVGGDSTSILIFDSSSNLLAGGTGSFTAPAGTTDTVWTDSAVAVEAAVATSFHVVVDNVLHTAAPATTDFAFIEKKGVQIDIGTGRGGAPGTPEPASLGVLGLGAVALLNRRRKA
jgi:hypothetical protein